MNDRNLVFSDMISNIDTKAIIKDGLNRIDLQGRRILMLIPDTTRTAPVGLIVKTIYRILNGHVSKLDILVALGTHKALSRDTMFRHLEMTQEEYRRNYSDMDFFNHQWDNPDSLTDIGVLPAKLIRQITRGIMEEDVKITINRMIFDYDHILIVGPVFPHEVAGFSGGNKYLFPGISGPEIIDFFHWLGAVITNMKTIGIADNPVRRVLNEAAMLVPLPVTGISMVIQEDRLIGLHVGPVDESWRLAAAQSARLNIIYKRHTFKQVLACAPLMYDDLWTGGKCMYKCEPVVADEGEFIIYAPHIYSLSHTHGGIMERIGYHVRDYYLKQSERFIGVPRVAMAVSSYLKGTGTYENGIEKPRISVSLATDIPPDICEKVGLGYIDSASIDLDEWQGREDEGILFVEKAGETLYLLENDREGVL